MDNEEIIQSIRNHINTINQDINTTIHNQTKKINDSNTLQNKINELHFKQQRFLYRNGKDPNKNIKKEFIIYDENVYPCWSSIPQEIQINLLYNYFKNNLLWENDEQIYNVIEKILKKYKKYIVYRNSTIENITIEFENFDIKEKEKTKIKKNKKSNETIAKLKQSMSKIQK